MVAAKRFRSTVRQTCGSWRCATGNLLLGGSKLRVCQALSLWVMPSSKGDSVSHSETSQRLLTAPARAAVTLPI